MTPRPTLSVSVVLLLLRGLSTGAPAEFPEAGPPAPDPASRPENVAFRKPYTMSAWPVRPRRGPAPDFFRVLTDGHQITSPDYRAWNSSLRFLNVSDIEIVIDLGQVHPIGEISARHYADSNRGFLPRREEYYVSDNGKDFFRIAEFVNPWDPAGFRPGATREDYTKTPRTFTSGPLRTKGRFVMVKRKRASHVRLGPGWDFSIIPRREWRFPRALGLWGRIPNLPSICLSLWPGDLHRP